jgi:hypothetical protein
VEAIGKKFIKNYLDKTASQKCSSCGDSVIAWFDVADIRRVVNSASSDSNAMNFSRSICHSFSWHCSWIRERSQACCLTTDEHCCCFNISHNWFDDVDCRPWADKPTIRDENTYALER